MGSESHHSPQKKEKGQQKLISFLFSDNRRVMGFEGGAGVNDMPVACQSRGVTEPTGEKNPITHRKRSANAGLFSFLDQRIDEESHHPRSASHFLLISS